jgi:hypothetical protein
MKPLPSRAGLLAAALLLSTQAYAEDFDGSKPLICAPVEAIDCAPGQDCVRGTPDDIGAPSFIRIDFAGKTITSAKRTTPIESSADTGNQLLLRGTELGYGWTLALDHASGKMSATLTDTDGAFVMFGSCTPL